jgi:hypothetical protein
LNFNLVPRHPFNPLDSCQLWKVFLDKRNHGWQKGTHYAENQPANGKCRADSSPPKLEKFDHQANAVMIDLRT